MAGVYGSKKRSNPLRRRPLFSSSSFVQRRALSSRVRATKAVSFSSTSLQNRKAFIALENEINPSFTKWIFKSNLFKTSSNSSSVSLDF